MDPHQLSIDALNTATPNLADLYIEQCTYTYSRLTPLQLSIDALNTTTPIFVDLYIYRTMHLYPLQIDPPIIQA